MVKKKERPGNLKKQYSPTEYAKANLLSQLPSVFKTITWGSVIVVCVMFLSDAIKAVSGTETFVVLWSNFLSLDFKFKANLTMSWAISAGCAAAYWKKKNQLNNYIKKYNPHIKSIEKLVDPDRSSSGIQETGITNPEDR